MTHEQKQLFQDRGYLRLHDALKREQVAPIARYVRGELKKLASGKGSSTSLKKLPVFQQTGRLSQMVAVPELEKKLISPGLKAMIASLTSRKIGPGHSQLLLSPPNQGTWSLRELNWHVDISRPARDGLPGIQAFVLLADVETHGGATLAVAGSHALMRDARSYGELREVLRRSENVERDLRAKRLDIVEMSGKAGDVYLMDMRLLHTPSINATKSFRMMATVRYILDDTV